MSKTSRSKELKDELRQRFEQHASEQDAYNQLKQDPRFDTLRLAKVKTIYNQLRTEKANNNKKKSVILPPIERLKRTEQLAFFRSTVECDHTQHHCLMRLHSASVDGRFFFLSDRTPTINNESNTSLIDTFSNKSSRIKLPLAIEGNEYESTFSLLAFDIGLLIERSDYDEVGYFSTLSLSLLELDWTNKGVRKLHTLKIEDKERRFILHDTVVDVIDQARFLLRYWRNDSTLVMKRGSVENDEILFQDDILISNRDPSFDLISLMGNTLYTFDLIDVMFHNDLFTCTFNLDEGVEILRDLSPFPTRFSHPGGMFIVCLAPNYIFAAVHFKETRTYGIIRADFETGDWIEMDFCTKSPITSVNFMAEGCLLIIQTTDNITQVTQEEVHSLRRTLYRVPLKTPEKLANLAWFSLVRSKSRMPNVNPHHEALNYLPFNSEIRSPLED